MSIRIRRAGANDFVVTEAIERVSDELLIEYLNAIDWPPVTRAEEWAGTLGFTLRAEDANMGEPANWRDLGIAVRGLRSIFGI